MSGRLPFGDSLKLGLWLKVPLFHLDCINLMKATLWLKLLGDILFSFYSNWAKHASIFFFNLVTYFLRREGEARLCLPMLKVRGNEERVLCKAPTFDEAGPQFSVS